MSESLDTAIISKLDEVKSWLAELTVVVTRKEKTFEENLIVLSPDEIMPSQHTRSKSVPRPQNEFILYRRNLQKRIGRFDNFGKFSKLASMLWNKEPNEIKNIFKILSKHAQDIHNLLYPNYRYKPRKGRQGKKKSQYRWNP